MILSASIDIIQQLIDSAINDTPITNQERGFLNSSPLPVLKFITVFLSAGMPEQAQQLTEYSESIAQDILAQYLTENVETVETNLRNNDWPEAGPQ